MPLYMQTVVLNKNIYNCCWGAVCCVKADFILKISPCVRDVPEPHDEILPQMISLICCRTSVRNISDIRRSSLP